MPACAESRLSLACGAHWPPVLNWRSPATCNSVSAAVVGPIAGVPCDEATAQDFWEIFGSQGLGPASFQASTVCILLLLSWGMCGVLKAWAAADSLPCCLGPMVELPTTAVFGAWMLLPSCRLLRSCPACALPAPVRNWHLGANCLHLCPATQEEAEAGEPFSVTVSLLLSYGVPCKHAVVDFR